MSRLSFGLDDVKYGMVMDLEQRKHFHTPKTIGLRTRSCFDSI